MIEGPARSRPFAFCLFFEAVQSENAELEAYAGLNLDFC